MSFGYGSHNFYPGSPGMPNMAQTSYTSMPTAHGYDNSLPSSPNLAKEGTFIRIAEESDFPYHRRDMRTRNYCVAGLIFSWVSGVGILGFGCWIEYLAHHKKEIWMLEHMVAEIVPLAIDVFVTALTLITGYIHTATLRWSLQREGRLNFNSNLRLFTSARRSAANRWPANLTFLVFITFAYASCSLIFWHSNEASSIEQIFSTGKDFIAVGGEPIILLGVCIIGFTAITTWAYASTRIPSWSSCPLETAYAAMRAGNIQHWQHRCMLSVHDANRPSEPVYPRNRQRGAWRAHKEVRWILVILWLLVLLCFLAAGLAHHLINDLLADDSWGNWSLIPTIGTQWLYFIPPSTNPDSLGVGLALIVLFAVLQAPLTLGVHCAELHVNLSRDEASWRKATTKSGCRLEEYDSIIAANTSWQALTLNAFKNLMHWVFGLGVKIASIEVSGGSHSGLCVAPAPLIYLAFLAVLCALFITYISARPPKGQQPAAFGHLQTLVDLVDEWSAVMFWGHKHDEYNVCHAGTYNHPQGVGPVKNALYW